MAIEGDALSDALILENGLRLVYRQEGPSQGPRVLLIMGLGGQLTFWPQGFIQGLHQRGYGTIRFDNRDCGLSSQCPEGDWPGLWKLWFGDHLPWHEHFTTPYTLDDMAADTAALVTALGQGPVHVIGVSLGGMIAQLLAARWPDLVKSLVLIMTSTSRPRLPGPTLQAQASLLKPLPQGREALIGYTMDALRAIGSPGYPISDEDLRELVTLNLDRAFHPDGTRRQLLAILASGDRVEALRRLRLPTLVIHGMDDPLIPCAGGEDIARCVPGARLVLIPGMGHDLSPALIPVLLEPILTHLDAQEPSTTLSG